MSLNFNTSITLATHFAQAMHGSMQSIDLFLNYNVKIMEKIALASTKLATLHLFFLYDGNDDGNPTVK